MIFRLSQKLNSKIKAGSLNPVPLDQNPLADWSCHLFTADRMQYIILSNTASLYTCVMYGAGITDDSRFIERALGTIREFTTDDNHQFVYQKFIAPSSGTIQFAKALSRSVTGSMNELVLTAKFMLETDEIAPHDMGFRLNDLLLSAIVGSDGKKYAKPREVFNLLANQIH